MHPKNLKIEQFTYDLPEGKIAHFPLPERDASKLLLFDHGRISQDIYKNLAEYLPHNSLLVFNDTKVVEARLVFQKDTGGIIEIFCLEPDQQYSDITSAMQQKGKVYWQCLIGGASKWKSGQILEKKIGQESSNFILKAKITDRLPDCFIIELSWEPEHLSFAEMLHIAGLIPIPPYLKRDATPADLERYQTIYANNDGSVAAPTAGLHFSDQLLQSLIQKNIQRCFVTLHVGAGTFKPVKSERMEGHHMHAEFIDVLLVTIEKLLQYKGNVFAVGTTSTRTLESLYWMGVKAYNNPDIAADDLTILQWEVYDDLMQYDVSVTDALQALITWMKKNELERLITKTQILIAPGYSFKIISGLVTNFHQPQSTLLLLVAALVGNDWKSVYEFALENDFRFLSYGDGCFLKSIK